MQNNNEKIFAVINLGWLGDTLLTGSLTQDIKLHYPNSKVIFIASKPFVEVAQGLQGVDEVYYFDKRNEHKGIFGPFKFAKKFPYKNKVDFAFVVHSHERSLLLALATGAKRKISAKIKKSPLNLFITDKINYTEEKIRNTYKADFNAEYLSILTKEKPISKMQYIYPKEYDIKIKNELETYGLKDKKIVGICPIAKDEWRSFSPELVAKFIEICDKNGLYTMITGTGKTADFTNELRKHTKINFLDLSNRTTIFELAAYINSCQAFLSVDTGPMHISYTLGQKTVCAFYKKSMIEEWGPKTFNNAIILCNADKEITPESCFEAINNLIGR